MLINEYDYILEDKRGNKDKSIGVKYITKTSSHVAQLGLNDSNEIDISNDDMFEFCLSIIKGHYGLNLDNVSNYIIESTNKIKGIIDVINEFKRSCDGWIDEELGLLSRLLSNEMEKLKRLGRSLSDISDLSDLKYLIGTIKE